MKIDKGIPVNANVGDSDPYVYGHYPWKLMEVGDSFFVSSITKSQIMASKRKAEKKFNMIFLANEVEGGVRIWRVR